MWDEKAGRALFDWLPDVKEKITTLSHSIPIRLRIRVGRIGQRVMMSAVGGLFSTTLRSFSCHRHLLILRGLWDCKRITPHSKRDDTGVGFTSLQRFNSDGCLPHHFTDFKLRLPHSTDAYH